MKNIFRILCLILLPNYSAAQEVITIPVESETYALVLQTDADGRLGIIYFGEKLNTTKEYALASTQYNFTEGNAGIYNNAYTPGGSWSMVEPALSITHADGNLSTELRYVSHETQEIQPNVRQLSILLKDPVYETTVHLFYKVYEKENVFEQWTSISNTEKGTVILNKYASANLYFSNRDFYLTHYNGTWAREMKPETTQLTAGIKTLDSKLGARANLYQPPTFMLHLDGVATETEGKVLLANLAWSGNFKFDFEKDSYGNLRLIAGVNPYQGAYHLAPGESFDTPALVYTYSENGKGEASRNLHSWARDYRIPDGNGSRLTLLNNWEATYFDFDENKIVSLFDGARKLGVDMFLLDDGWFANKYPRNGDKAGLGDWEENRKKLPHGLGYLVKEATAHGLKFGIWVEPEMVNPKSELYENHIDWVIRQPERPEHYFRNQLVLDLSNPEVQDFVYGVLDKIFTANPEIAFVKWDCNAVIYNAHSQYLESKKMPQTHLYVDYVNGLYKVLDRLRSKYPKVPMMLCSGGGGRVDYGALAYFTEFWLSDNTDPLERVFLQWDYSHFFPAISLCAHVTDWDKTASIKYRTDVAMMGKLGFDIVVDELSPNDLRFCQQAVKNYQSLSEVIWHGDLFRLLSPYKNAFAALMFVNEKKERAVVFNYLVSNRFDFTYSYEPVKLQGLDAAKKYEVKEINTYPETASTITKNIYSGDFLMKVGFNPDVTLQRKSVVLEITALD
ncbi:MAG: alpha-galactosidase [Saprospiraceae bacterium]|jgi:alpha-galactosidase